jgi:DNA polymerase (family 10)
MSIATNSQIADWFDKVADFLELDNANPYRIQAYRRAAGTIRQHPRDIARMVMASEDLTGIPNIGPDTAAKIREIVLTGSSHFLDRIARQVPVGLRRFRRIAGLGPKRIRKIYQALGITTLKELRQAALNQQIRQVPGFGIALENNILASLRRSALARH